METSIRITPDSILQCILPGLPLGGGSCKIREDVFQVSKRM